MEMFGILFLTISFVRFCEGKSKLLTFFGRAVTPTQHLVVSSSGTRHSSTTGKATRYIQPRTRISNNSVSSMSYARIYITKSSRCLD